MNFDYYNFDIHLAHNWLDRQFFIGHWWQFYRHDPFWVPPYYPVLRRSLEFKSNPHLARLNPLFIHLQALARRQPSNQNQPLSFGYNLEKPVAAAIVLTDPRRVDKAAYLALLRVVNNDDCLERLLEALREPLWMQGVTKLIGPTNLSPHLGTGLLLDHWDVIPPLDTPYNPPYLPEVVGSVLRARRQGQLYQFDISAELSLQAELSVELLPFQPHRLASDLLPLFQVACLSWLDFPSPDVLEAEFLLKWIGHWPLFGWLAQSDNQPVGFILVQPDLASKLRQAVGGRNYLWRLWLKSVRHRPVENGRILYLGVLPEWRRRGIGRQLVAKALAIAQEQGWATLRIGPMPATAPAGEFLTQLGAEAKQNYRLYEWNL